MNGDHVVRLSIFPDRGQGEHRAVEWKIDRRVWAESLAPLPQDREIPFMVESHQRAEAMKKKRSEFIRELADKMTAHLLKLIEQADTVNGYPQEKA